MNITLEIAEKMMDRIWKAQLPDGTEEMVHLERVECIHFIDDILEIVRARIDKALI